MGLDVTQNVGRPTITVTQQTTAVNLTVSTDVNTVSFNIDSDLKEVKIQPILNTVSNDGIEEAPINGKDYVRKNGEWLEINPISFPISTSTQNALNTKINEPRGIYEYTHTGNPEIRIYNYDLGTKILTTSVKHNLILGQNIDFNCNTGVRSRLPSPIPFTNYLSVVVTEVIDDFNFKTNIQFTSFGDLSNWWFEICPFSVVLNFTYLTDRANVYMQGFFNNTLLYQNGVLDYLDIKPYNLNNDGLPNHNSMMNSYGYLIWSFYPKYGNIATFKIEASVYRFGENIPFTINEVGFKNNTYYSQGNFKLNAPRNGLKVSITR